MGAGDKTRRRAAKQAHKRALESEFALQPTPRRGKDKCFMDRTRQQGEYEREPRQTVLSARCRRLGVEDTEERRLSMAHSVFSDDAGVAVSLGTSGNVERDALWKTFCDLDRVEETYHRRILQRSRHAKCGKMEFIPERFEAQPGDAVDTRDDETKDRDAVNNWMRWRGFVGHLGAHEQNALWSGVYIRCDLHKDGALTSAGKAFVQALSRLTDVAAAKRG